MCAVGSTEANQSEVLQNARDNAASFAMVTIAFLKQRGTPVADWVWFMGELFAPAWDDLKGDMTAVARHVRLKLENCGGAVAEQAISESDAQLLVVWPAGEAAGFAQKLGILGEDAAQFLRVFEPIADRLGLALTIAAENPGIRIHFHQP